MVEHSRKIFASEKKATTTALDGMERNGIDKKADGR